MPNARRFLTSILIALFVSREAASASFSVSRKCIDLLHTNDPSAPLDLAHIPTVRPYDSKREFSRVPMGEFTQERWNLVKEMVEFASKQMRRRGWSENFLEERLEVARSFFNRSEYFATRGVGYSPQERYEISGTIGITVATQNSKGHSIERLPMEATHGWKLARPLGSDGESKIIEMRTYAIRPFTLVDPYNALWGEVNRMIHREYADFPELMSKKVIYTYGDETSYRMYRAMGFELADEKIYPPVVHDGTTWRVLVATPDDMLRGFLSRQKQPYLALGLKGELSIKDVTGRKWWVNADAGIAIKETTPFSFTVARKTEVFPGVWAGEGSFITLSENGRVESITKLGEDALLPSGLVARAGTWITFQRSPPYDPGYITLAKDAQLPGIANTVPKGSQVVLGVKPMAEILELGADMEVDPARLPGVFAKAGSHVDPGVAGERLAIHLAKETELAPGIFAAENSEVEFRKFPDGSYRLRFVDNLSRQMITSERIVKPGNSYLWTEPVSVRLGTP